MKNNNRNSVLRMIILMLLLGSITLPTLAQQEKGDKELQLQGLITVSFGENKSASGTVFINFGYFFTDRQEVGVGTNLTLGGGAGNIDLSAGVTGFYRYHLLRKKENLRPYIGIDLFSAALIGGGSSDANSATPSKLDLTFLRPNIGFKYFFKRNVAFDVNSGYGFSVKSAKNGQFDSRLGVSYIF